MALEPDPPIPAAHPPTTPDPNRSRNRFLHRWTWRLLRLLRRGGLILLLSWLLWVALPVLVGMLSTPGTPGLFTLWFLFVELTLIGCIASVAYLYYRLTTRTHVTWMRPGTTGVSFGDYHGNPAALTAGQHLVTRLQAARTTPTLVRILPGGVLLQGTPGSGRSYLARAIATTAGVPLGWLNLAPLTTTRLGRLKVMRFYRQARQLAREYGACIVFLEGLDALADETDLLHELLFQLNPPAGSNRHALLGWLGQRRPLPPPVLTLAAVTPTATLNPALLHPRRFTLTIPIKLPDAAGRRALLASYLNQVRHDPLPLERIIVETSGYTPLALRQLIDTAGSYAHADNRLTISYADITRARVTCERGMDSPDCTHSFAERRRMAYHMAGHACIQRRLAPLQHNEKLTLHHLQADALSHTPDTSSAAMSHEELLINLQILLAGRATEAELLGTTTTAAAADLQQATRLALQMAGVWGMNGRLSAYAASETADLMALLRDEQIRAEAEAILQGHYLQVRRFIADNGEAVTRLAEALILCTELLPAEIEVILEGKILQEI